VHLASFTADKHRFAAAIEDLRFKFHKWDAYVNGTLRILSEALVLTFEEHADAVACCTKISSALGRAEAVIRDDPCLMERIAIPRDLQAIIREEPASPYQIARYDLIPTASGWMIPEFNEDAPGGFNEAIAANALFEKFLDQASIAGDFGASFQKSMPQGNTVGIVYATGYAEDLQHMLILSDLLQELGLRVVLGSPEHLTCGRFGKPRLMGTPMDWILRFFPGEWFDHMADADLTAWRRAVARVPMVNPLSRLIRQSKGLYALWREEQLLDPDDTSLLNQYTPHSVFFNTSDIFEYRDRREELVLKKHFGRMGDAVVMGHLCKPNVWEDALMEAAAKSNDYIVQQAFSPLPSSNGADALYPALGVYLINGAFAGYYSRADASGFTTHEAYYAVTAVKTA
jgi:glutathionylspermidine synthase